MAIDGTIVSFDDWVVEYKFPQENGWQRHWTNLPIENKEQGKRIWDQMRKKYRHLQWRVRHSREEIPYVSFATVDPE